MSTAPSKTGPDVQTCFWFADAAEEAAEFYVSLLPDSRIGEVSRAESGEAAIVSLTLRGTPFLFLNGGPHFEQTPAASIYVSTADQAETDRLWDALTSNGGAESRCGWLRDRFGVSWQIVPAALPRLLKSDDRAAAARAREAMLEMNRLDVSRLEAAFRGAS